MDLNNVEFSWIKDKPQEWRLDRVKNHFVLTKNTTDNPDNYPILSLTMKGIIERDVSTNEGQLPETYNGYNLLEENDIVFNPMDLISGWVDCSPTQGLISPSYKVIRPISESVNIKFYTYYFQTHYKERIFFPFGEGVHYEYRWGLGTETLRNFPIVVPPLSEQQQIVSFLDTKTSLIDSLIEKTQRKIELLKEKRTSLINEVVTKGLNPNVEMKDSGVEWIGEIPSGWKSSRLGHYSYVYRGSGYQYLNQVDEDYEGGKERVVRISDITEFKPIWCEYQEQFENYRIKPDNILIGGTGHYFGKSIYVTKEMEGLIHSYNIIRVVIKIQYPKYVQYWLSSSKIREQMDISVLGSGQPFIDIQGLKDLHILIPPLSEQQQIVSYLDEHTQLIDKTIFIEEKRIELLKEYRQSLISEVVTGKRKVVE